ncbi:malonyl-ACP O-methyltransferase BioC [Luteimonas sp. MJ174]|uniref:malonyl-ACP O-methyltransferase BioC n=1 Tax=Luteimonas sp. MJ174 TaxID=3129237 RepID=UPI0031BA323F
MSHVFDRQQVRRAFSRAACSYSAASELQREVESRLLESLEYLGEQAPADIVDLGSGPGTGAVALRQRWPKARVVAIDLALPMLRQVAPRRGWNPLQRPIDRVCADARALPLADDSVDLLFSNLCLQWVEDLDALFAGFRRVLRPGGMLLCSTFGPATLHELRAAFAEADQDAAHVSPFAGIAEFGDALMRAGFRDPVLDRDVDVHGHADMAGLMRGLRELGATNALATRRRELTGRGRFVAARAAYEQWRGDDSLLPATWETITAMAWAPAHGQPIREGGEDVARFPASGIPVRRRRG